MRGSTFRKYTLAWALCVCGCFAGLAQGVDESVNGVDGGVSDKNAEVSSKQAPKQSEPKPAKRSETKTESKAPQPATKNTPPVAKKNEAGKAVSVALPDHPHEMIKEMTNRLLKELEQFKLLETEAEKEAFAKKVVDETFSAMVDFDLIARRVMAKHFSYASVDQRDRFAKQFRESLINTYAMGMAAYSDQKVLIKPFEGIRDAGKRKRATVEMEILTSEGDRYPIVYSLYETKDGPWKLENIIINGVNIGLTFRNQFHEALSAKAGNIDAVIDDWNTKVSVN